MHKPFLISCLFIVIALASVTLAAASEALPPELTLVQCSNPLPIRLFLHEQGQQVQGYLPPNAVLYKPSAGSTPYLRYWVLAKTRVFRGQTWLAGWLDTTACQR